MAVRPRFSLGITDYFSRLEFIAVFILGGNCCLSGHPCIFRTASNLSGIVIGSIVRKLVRDNAEM